MLAGLSGVRTLQYHGADAKKVYDKFISKLKENNIIAGYKLSDKQILETEQDVDNYINKLSAELKAKIRDNKRIRLQG